MVSLSYLGLAGTDTPADRVAYEVIHFLDLSVFVVSLTVATILSISKPWSRTRWGRRALARKRDARPAPCGRGRPQTDALQTETSWSRSPAQQATSNAPAPSRTAANTALAPAMFAGVTVM